MAKQVLAGENFENMVGFSVVDVTTGDLSKGTPFDKSQGCFNHHDQRAYWNNNLFTKSKQKGDTRHVEKNMLYVVIFYHHMWFAASNNEYGLCTGF